MNVSDISYHKETMCVYVDRITAYISCAEHLFAEGVWTHSSHSEYHSFPSSLSSLSILWLHWTSCFLFHLYGVCVCKKSAIMHDTAFVWFCSVSTSISSVHVFTFVRLTLLPSPQLVMCHFANVRMFPPVIHIL